MLSLPPPTHYKVGTLSDHHSAQVIAPYLIILRVAKRKALTGEMVASGSNNLSSIRFVSQVTMDSDCSLPGGDPTCSTRANREALDEVNAMSDNEIEEDPSRQGHKIP